MSTKSNDSVVLGLDIPKTRKNITADLKKVLKSIKPETLKLADVDTKKISQAITDAVQKAYQDAADKLPAMEVSLEAPEASASTDSAAQSINNIKELFNSLRKEIDDSVLMSAALTELKKSLHELMQMDTILADIGKTGSLSAAQLQDLKEASFETAGKYGRTSTDYLNNVQKMYASGFGNADKMAELSLLAQTAGNMSEELAASYLKASNSAYNLKENTSELGKILDGQVSIAQNSTIQLEDMAGATIEAASAASKYNIQAGELSALIALASDNSMESGTEIGKGLSYIFSSLHETDQLKNPIELLNELASAYHALEENSPERLSILDQFGGAEHSGTLKAILDNWSSYQKMLGSYAGGSGSAMEEASRSADSWEGALNRLHNTWNETISNISDSEGITAFLNIINELLGALESVTDFLGPLGSLGVIIGSVLGSKNLGRADI